MSTGERIKRERNRRGWSQRELARRAGIAQGGLSKLENGERLHGGSTEVLQKIAVALDTPIDALLHEIPTEDLSQPPLELFRAAGYADEVVAPIIANWSEQLPATRARIVARAKQRAQEAQAVTDARMADEDALRKEFGPLALIF